jgi:hypothetical protein
MLLERMGTLTNGMKYFDSVGFRHDIRRRDVVLMVKDYSFRLGRRRCYGLATTD